MGRRSSRSTPAPDARVPDPFGVLGLTPAATLAEVDEARRSLAKSAHPDVGGSVVEMQRINAAADAATRLLAVPTAGATGRGRDESPPPSRSDHPSFTIEALPAEAFEALLVVAGWLGEAIDDDPPYRLEVALVDPVRGWCRLDLVPDAGASTVSLLLESDGVEGEPGALPPDVERVRDAWIAALNQLDWDDLGGSPLRP